MKDWKLKAILAFIALFLFNSPGLSATEAVDCCEGYCNPSSLEADKAACPSYVRHFPAQEVQKVFSSIQCCSNECTHKAGDGEFSFDRQDSRALGKHSASLSQGMTTPRSIRHIVYTSPVASNIRSLQPKGKATDIPKFTLHSAFLI